MAKAKDCVTGRRAGEVLGRFWLVWTGRRSGPEGFGIDPREETETPEVADAFREGWAIGQR